MSIFEDLLMAFPVLMFAVGFIIIVYLIFKRIEDKNNEDFEKRDN